MNEGEFARNIVNYREKIFTHIFSSENVERDLLFSFCLLLLLILAASLNVQKYDWKGENKLLFWLNVKERKF